MEKRLKFVSVVFLATLGLLALRAFDMQVVRADSIIAQAHRRFSHTINLNPQRGIIQDRHGEPLAVSLEVKSIAANSKSIKNPEKAAASLARILKVNQRTLAKKLKSDRHFVWIKRHATPDEVAAVRKLDIEGVGFYDDTRRFYPESEAMANVLGIVGIDGNGLEGLERQYDHLLVGKPRQASVQRDGHGRTIYARGATQGGSTNGCTIALSIDRRVQYIAYEELKHAIRENNARAGFVIITNPQTGEIYALASYPSFDPNKGSYQHLTGHKNLAIADNFEPGSIMKPVWIGWGINNGTYSPSQTVFCENGNYEMYRKRFHDHEKHGWLPVRDVIKYSSNIGMIKLTEAVSAADMHAALCGFGFAAPTGIDFPGEATGLVRDPSRWRGVDKATVSFGQGFAVSGIQMITAFNALVNGGLLLKPTLLSRVHDENGNALENFRPTITRKVISQKTSEEMTGILKSVTLTGGTGTAAYMENYQVFGKTGTAQKTDPLTGAYSTNAYISSFAGGIVDATGRPVLTMLVVIDEPHPSYYASTVVCPVFKRIALKTVNIMDIRPILTVARGEQ